MSLSNQIENESQNPINDLIIKDVIYENSELYKQIYDKKIEIQKIKLNIKHNNNKLWENCNHNWIRDSSAILDMCKFKCNKCNLYRRKNYNDL